MIVPGSLVTFVAYRSTATHASLWIRSSGPSLRIELDAGCVMIVMAVLSQPARSHALALCLALDGVMGWKDPLYLRPC